MQKENINQIYDILNEEQKANYLKQFNRSKKNLVILFSCLTLFFVIIFIIGLIRNISIVSHIDLLWGILGNMFFIVIWVVCLLFTIKTLKWSDEEKIKKKIALTNKKSSLEEIEVSTEPSTEEINTIATLTNKLFFNYANNSELCEIIKKNLNANASILDIEFSCIPIQKLTLTTRVYKSLNAKKYRREWEIIKSNSTTELRLPTTEFIKQTTYSKFIKLIDFLKDLSTKGLSPSFIDLKGIFTLLKRQNIIKSEKISLTQNSEWLERAEFNAFLFLFRCFKLKNLLEQIKDLKLTINNSLEKLEASAKEIITTLFNSSRFSIEEIINYYSLIEYSKEPISTPFSNIYYKKGIKAILVIQELLDKEKIDRLKSGKYQDKHKYTMLEIDNMNGQEFEKFVTELFQNLGYQAKNTKLSGDQGVDVIAKKENQIAAIQAKHYNNQTVGNHAIMEVVGGAKLHNANICYVVTNNYFTRSAKELAAVHNVILWDRDKLIEKLTEI